MITKKICFGIVGMFILFFAMGESAFSGEVMVTTGSEWKYTDTDTEQTGWYKTDFDDSGWNTGKTPFVSNEGNCGLGKGTVWPVYKTFYLRKLISVSNQQNLRLQIAIDNDFVLYMDGNQIASEKSENCAFRWQYEYTVSATQGNHTIAVKLIDRGAESGFDMQVSTFFTTDNRIYTQTQLDQAVADERKRWDVNGDNRIGLEDIIYMLQVIVGLRP